MSKTGTQRFDLTGQNVLITGGLGILGQGFVRGFLECGARVVVFDRPENTASQLAELFPNEGNRLIGFPVDLGDDASLRSGFEEAAERVGGFTHLLANAASKGSDIGAFMKGPETFSIDTWREVMRVNLDSTFLLAQLFGNDCIARKSEGSLTIISSIYGVVAPDPALYDNSFYLGGRIDTPPIYAASKAGVIGLARYLASYWGAHGLRANCVSPGGVESGQNDEFRERYEAKVPLKRLAQIDDMVGPAIFLASDAARYVTGQNIVVDGGLSVR